MNDQPSTAPDAISPVMAGLSAYMADPLVLALQAKMTLVSDPDLPRREGIVTVTTTDGRRLDRHVPHVRGTTNNPMTRDEVDAKVTDLMTPVLGVERARRLIDAVWGIEAAEDVRGLRALLTA